MKNLVKTIAIIILGAASLTSCKKDLSGLPVPFGKPSIALKLEKDKVPAGGKTNFDLTFTSASSLKRFYVEQTITHADGSQSDKTIIFDTAYSAGVIESQYNYYFNPAETLSNGDVVKIDLSLENNKGTAHLSREIKIEAPAIGLDVYNTVSEIKSTEQMKHLLLMKIIKYMFIQLRIMRLNIRK